MANSFTRVMCGRSKAVMMASLGAGTLASAYLLSDGAAAADRKRLYPPRYACAQSERVDSCEVRLSNSKILLFPRFICL